MSARATLTQNDVLSLFAKYPIKKELLSIYANLLDTYKIVDRPLRLRDFPFGVHSTHVQMMKNCKISPHSQPYPWNDEYTKLLNKIQKVNDSHLPDEGKLQAYEHFKKILNATMSGKYDEVPCTKRIEEYTKFIEYIKSSFIDTYERMYHAPTHTLNIDELTNLDYTATFDNFLLNLEQINSRS